MRSLADGDGLELLYGSSEPEEMDGFREPWYRVRADKDEGWVYGAYLSRYVPLASTAVHDLKGLLASRDVSLRYGDRGPVIAEWNRFLDEVRAVAAMRPYPRMGTAMFRIHGHLPEPGTMFEIEVRVFTDADHTYTVSADDTLLVMDAFDARSAYRERLRETDGIVYLGSVPWAVGGYVAPFSKMTFLKYEHHSEHALVTGYMGYYGLPLGPFRYNERGTAAARVAVWPVVAEPRGHVSCPPGVCRNPINQDMPRNVVFRFTAIENEPDCLRLPLDGCEWKTKSLWGIP